ncbi:tyrosine-type recombinase/integrase [Paraburkholderia sediminicola]|uniref:tyrosine-type recombinase/integrase n=1 Tax=Paraburkholderia sediminicola TaxID=458836 RepID=UPI0038B96F99
MFADKPREEFVAAFGRWFESSFENPYSPTTKRVYLGVIRDFLSFAADHSIAAPHDVNGPWVRLFAAGGRTAERSGYSATYRNVRLAALSVFWEWLMLTGQADENPIVAYVRMRSDDNSQRSGRPAGGKKAKRLPPVLLWEHQKALLAAAEAATTRTSVRDHALMSLVLATGLRSDEVCTLELASVNLEYRRLRVIGKGDKERLVDFSHAAEVVGTLEMWIEDRQEILENGNFDSPFFFVTRSGKRLTGSLVYQQVSRYIRVAGLEPYLTRKGGAHVLRHTATSIMFARSVPILQIQENLGHEDLKTTQIYAHLLPREQRETSPLDFR